MQTVEYRNQELPLPASLTAVLPKRLLLCIQSFGAHRIEEIRLYRNGFASLTAGEKNFVTDCFFSGDEIEAVFSAFCEGSPYAHRDSILHGYLSPGDGIRVGLAGRALVEGGQVLGLTDLSGLVIRVPHALMIPVEELLPLSGDGLLIYAPPGVGKTTLLRSLARRLSENRRTVLLDPKGELAGGLGERQPAGMLHLLTGFPPGYGIEIAVQNLGAECILTDEIGSEAEADALLAASNRGVPIIATAHAKKPSELLLRPAIRRLIEAGVFEELVGLSRKGYGRFSFDVRQAKSL